MGPAVVCSKPAGTSRDCPEEQEARVGRGTLPLQTGLFPALGLRAKAPP